MILKNSLLVYTTALLVSCAVPVVKKGYDFSRISKIHIQTVADIENISGSGQAVERLLVHQLIADGYPIVNGETPGVDGAILVCNIIEFKDSKTVLVPVEILSTGATTRTVEKKIISERDSLRVHKREELLTRKTVREPDQVKKYSEWRYFEASIGLSLQLVDVSSKQVVWSSNYQYNSLNRTTAIRECIKGGLRTLKKVLAI